MIGSAMIIKLINRNHLVQIIIGLFCLGLLFTCSKTTTDPGIDPEPEVRIVYPPNGAIITDTTSIVVEASDDKGVVKVEIYINNYTSWDRTFFVEPYRYLWTTPQTEDSARYRIYAKAYDGDENVSSSQVIDVTVYRFRAPSDLIATQINDNLIRINWVDNSVGETGFVIEKSIDYDDFTVVATVPAEQTEYLDSDIDTTHSYAYRIKAVREDRESDYSPAIRIQYQNDMVLNQQLGVGYYPMPDDFLLFERTKETVTWSINRSSKAIHIETGATLYSTGLAHHLIGITSLKWDKTSDILVFSTATGLISLSQYNEGNSSWMFGYTFPQSISDMAFFTNPTSLFVMGADSLVYKFDIQNQTIEKTYPVYHNGSKSISVNSNKNIMATTGNDTTINVWDVNSENLLYSIPNLNYAVKQIRFSIDGNYLFGINGDEPVIYVWNALTGDLVKTYFGNTAPVSFIAIETSGRYLVSGDNTGRVLVWSLSNDAILFSKINIHNQKIIAIDCYNYSNEKIGVSSVSRDGNIYDWIIEKRWVSNY
jgi:WD40 repeat protein